MKILFLDLDWVLIKFWDTPQIRKSRSDKHWNFKSWIIYDFDLDLVENLKHIIEETWAWIVISSSWRHNMERVRDSFYAAWLDWNRVISRTPDSLWHWRWNEILSWLNYYHENCWVWSHVKKWVAIDDDSFDMKCVSRLWRFVHTKTSEWLTKEKAKEVIELLK